MRRHILVTTAILGIFWASDAAAQLRRPGGLYQPRQRPIVRDAEPDVPNTPAELDLHLTIARLDGGLIAGGRFTKNASDAIAFEGGFDHDHGNRRYGEKLLTYGGVRWKLSGSTNAAKSYLTAGVAGGWGYSFALTPFVGMSARGSCAEVMCLRADAAFYPAAPDLAEHFRASVGVSVALR